MNWRAHLIVLAIIGSVGASIVIFTLYPWVGGLIIFAWVYRIVYEGVSDAFPPRRKQ